MNVRNFKHLFFRAARYSKINLDIVLPCLNIQDNNRYVDLTCSDYLGLRLFLYNQLAFCRRSA